MVENMPALTDYFCKWSPWINNSKYNIKFEKNLQYLRQLQQYIKKYLKRKHIKEYLQSEAFVAWYYAPNMPGGKKAKKELENLTL